MCSAFQVAEWNRVQDSRPRIVAPGLKAAVRCCPGSVPSCEKDNFEDLSCNGGRWAPWFFSGAPVYSIILPWALGAIVPIAD